MVGRRALAFGLLLIAMPPATAQGDGWTLLFEDGKDDVFLSVVPDGQDPTPTELGPDSQVVDGPDLRRVEAQDTETDLIFRAEFHAPDAALDLQSAAFLQIDLAAGSQRYFADMSRSGGRLYFVDGLGELHSIAQLEGGDGDDGLWRVFVPREHLRDETGAPPEKGSVVQVLGIEAQGGYVYVGPNQFTVRDAVDGQPIYVFSRGLSQTGPGQLVLPQRSVASNGEGTAHAYPFEVRNTDNVPHSFELVVSELPKDSWTPSFVRREIRLEGAASLQDTLVVTVPFAHQHGERDEFFLTLRQLDGSGEAKARLSVYYFTIPQPTGHHDTLWIHSRANVGAPDLSPILGNSHGLFMNTLAEDPDSATVPVMASGFQAPRKDYHWPIPMSPELGLPLSFDATGIAHLRAAFSSAAPQVNAQVSAVLSFDGIDEAVVDFPSVAIDLQSGEASVDLPGHVQTAFIEALRGKNLILHVYMTADNMPASPFGAQLPSLLPGAELVLPLLEYRASTGAAESLDLRLGLGERSLRVAADSGAAFEGTIENRAAGPVTLAFSVEGVNATWFHAVPDLRLEAGEAAAFRIPFDVPAEAGDGDLADVIVRVTRDGGSGVSERLLVVVSGEGDAGSADGASADTPGIPLILVLSALAAALLARRRR